MDKKRNFGFTLIELLVVISIISILTIISVSQFNTAKIKARDTQRKSDLDSVAKAINMYYADYGEFPNQDKVVWGETFVDDPDVAEPYYYMRVMPTESHLESEFCYLPANDFKSYLLLGNMEGDGMMTGEYSVPDGCDGSSYNFVLAGPNTTVNSFCDDTGLCTMIP